MAPPMAEPSAPRFRVGTSGYNYPEWKGAFYPEGLATGKMLPYYAERFSTVEINYTFYRLPNAKTVAGWTAATPDDFTFALKASQKITHFQRFCFNGTSPVGGFGGELLQKEQLRSI